MIREAAIAAALASTTNLTAAARARLEAVLESGDVADLLDVSELEVAHYDDQRVVFSDNSLFLQVTRRGDSWDEVSLVQLASDGWVRVFRVASLAELGAFLLVNEPPRVPEPGEPTPWRAPASKATAYRTNDRVVHNGRLWASQMDANLYVPGMAGWRDLGPVTDEEPPPPPVEEPGAVLVWKPWTSGLPQDLYREGDRVTHAGRTWVALVGNNHWEPGAPGTEALWRPVTT